jgi:hypothetical protein
VKFKAPYSCIGGNILFPAHLLFYSSTSAAFPSNARDRTCHILDRLAIRKISHRRYIDSKLSNHVVFVLIILTSIIFAFFGGFIITIIIIIIVTSSCSWIILIAACQDLYYF